MIMWRSIAAPLVHKMQKSWLEQGLEKHIENCAKKVEKYLQKGTQNGGQNRDSWVYFEALCPRVPQGGSKDPLGHATEVKPYPKSCLKGFNIGPNLLPKGTQN